LRSQKLLFDPKRFESFRKKNYRVTIYDELTGLYVEMFSWDEVDKQLAQIDFQCDLVLCD
jgi:ATP:corrinoid adenosyltransferase